jgi:hypothetical protein
MDGAKALIGKEVTNKNLDPRYRWFGIVLPGQRLEPKVFVFRGLNRKEHRVACSRETQLEREDYILSCCVVGDHDWDSVVVGTYRKILTMISKISGLDEEELPFKEAIAWLYDDLGAYEAAAVAMVSNLDIQTLETCDPSHHAKYLAIGKFLFESLYKRDVRDAFKPQADTSPGPVLQTGNVGPPTSNGPERQESARFEWVRSKNADPNAPRAPDVIPEEWVADRRRTSRDLIGDLRK